jgi:hypothetical protein
MHYHLPQELAPCAVDPLILNWDQDGQPMLYILSKLISDTKELVRGPGFWLFIIIVALCMVSPTFRWIVFAILKGGSGVRGVVDYDVYSDR